MRDVIQGKAAETGQQHDSGNPDVSFRFHSLSKQNQVSRAAASFTPAQKCAGGGGVRFSEGVYYPSPSTTRGFVFGGLQGENPGFLCAIQKMTLILDSLKSDLKILGVWFTDLCRV